MMFLLKWKLAALALATLAAIAAVVYYGHTQKVAGRGEVQAEWAEQREAQTAAALTSLQSAIERDAAERKALEERRIAAGETLLGAVNTIRARVGAINQKLEESRNADPACAAYLDSRIACPLPWRVPDDAHPGTDNHPSARPDDIHTATGVVPPADLARGADADDQFRPAPVHGRIARED